MQKLKKSMLWQKSLFIVISKKWYMNIMVQIVICFMDLLVWHYMQKSKEELIRIVDAVQFHEEHGEVCPAGWQKGDKGMDASPDGVASYLSGNADKL